jgi:hypothetical protein
MSEEAKKRLAGIREGDRVWVGGSRSKGRDRIQTVLRVTNTLFVTDGHPTRFRRDTGLQVGGGTSSSRIGGAATPEEYEEWRAGQEAARRAREAAKAEADAREALRRELGDLFGANAYVQRGDDEVGGWQVTFHLSEEGVRRLAELIKTNPQLIEGRGE